MAKRKQKQTERGRRAFGLLKKREETIKRAEGQSRAWRKGWFTGKERKQKKKEGKRGLCRESPRERERRVWTVLQSFSYFCLCPSKSRCILLVFFCLFYCVPKGW